MRRLLIVIVILLLATGLRFGMLEAQSFWNDEGNSARLSERAISLIIEGTASDIHPPLYYLLLHGWQAGLGDDEFGLRALSAFAGMVTVAATYAVGRQLGAGRKTGFAAAATAAFLAAVSPALIYYSQETRMYALLALWSILSTWFLLRIPRAARPVFPAVAYVAISAAGLYTHYSYPAVLLWQNGVALAWLAITGRAGGRFPWRSLLAWLGLMGATVLLYLPWLPIFWRQVGGRPGDQIPVLDFLGEAARFVVLGETVGPDELSLMVWLAGLLALVGVGSGLYAMVKNRPVTKQAMVGVLVPLLGLTVPALAMAAAGATRPAFFKFLVVTIPFFCLLAGQGVVASGAILRRGTEGSIFARVVAYGLGIIVVGLFLGGTGRSLHNLYYNPQFARADYRGMAARIAAEEHPNAGIILNAANQWEVFTYYHQEGAPVYPLPAGRAEADLLAVELAAIADAHDRLYVLFWGDAERDPERLVERWLDAYAFKAREEWVGDVRFVTYAVPEAPAGEPEMVTGVPFGPQITLTGYTVTPTTLPAGDIVQITLFWETDSPLETRYKVFLHLVNEEEGQIVAQRDSEPGGGLALTNTWPAGETVVDNHGLLIPLETPPGRYTLLLGLYDVNDPTARLTTGDGRDMVVLESVTVR